MGRLTNVIWFEKYRPKTLAQMSLSAENLEAFESFIDDESIPHILLIGPPGGGKTTTANILINSIPCTSLSLNASSKDRGIETIRGKVKTFASSKQMQGNLKMVFLDEADYMCLTEDTEVIIGSLQNPEIRKIKDLPKLKHANGTKIGREVMIPSFNIETKSLENDKGYLSFSGEAVFYEIELEDSRIIKASTNHPFFNSNLEEVKVSDLKIGDKIVDLQDEIFHLCPACESVLLLPQQITCSKDCANKLHSKRMIENNPNHGKIAWNKGLTKDIDPRVAAQANHGRDNGNHKSNGGKWYGLKIWTEGTEEQIRLLKEKLSKAHSGKKYDDYNRAIRSKYGIDGFLDTSYRRHLPDAKTVECEVCRKYVKNGGIDGIYVHHKDHDRSNNDRENLMFVCPFCHNMVLHDCIVNFLKKGWSVLR